MTEKDCQHLEAAVASSKTEVASQGKESPLDMQAMRVKKQ